MTKVAIARTQPDGETGEYSTVTVATHPDMWTAKISRSIHLSGGRAPKTGWALVNVGSISHLLRTPGLAKLVDH